MSNNNLQDITGGGNMEERLWNFIDGTADNAEKTVVEQLLQTDAAWKAKYKELIQVDEWMQSAELEMPSVRFTKNVMEEISRTQIAPATKKYINNRIIWGLGIFFITMLAGFLIYGFAQVNINSGKPTAISKNLDKINFSHFFSNSWINAFMLVNVVIGLVLLDNFLSARRKQFRGEQ